MSRIIITGGPGSGKSTLLGALHNAGFEVVPEVSRELIREQVAAGSDCLPWVNLAAFAQLCLEKMEADFRLAKAGTITFFDRGIPDILAYLKTGGLPAGQLFHEVAAQCRYAPKVFVAPPWQEIYVNDAERWQTFAEAVQLHDAICQIYRSAGYQLITLPKVEVGQRVEFITKTISKCV